MESGGAGQIVRFCGGRTYKRSLIYWKSLVNKITKVIYLFSLCYVGVPQRRGSGEALSAVSNNYVCVFYLLLYVFVAAGPRFRLELIKCHLFLLLLLLL